ncbi:MAG TPA: glycosyltransferase family 39 protein [Candidatus Bathyarchaeia archaeon]|nr:glycosyltransferase family 39 protein [Candidatus Bathyarchaeia archaeon]
MKQASENSLHYKLLVLLIVAASCVRVFVCFQHNPMDYLYSDMQRHWGNGLGFPRGGYFGASDPIVYQVYIWVLQHLTRSNRLLVAAASALLSVLMPWTYYRAARNFGLGKIPALWVWALIAWTPSLFTIYHYIMMETLLLLLEGVALWMTARYLRKGGTEAFLLFVLSWTLASLTKPTVIPLAVVCSLWVWWKRSTTLKQIGMGAVLAGLLLVPQAVRSKVELGFIAPFGNPWLTRIMLRSGARTTHVHFYTHPDQQLHFRASVKDGDMDFGSPSGFQQPLEPLSSWAIRRAYVDSKAHVIINSANGERDWKDACAAFNVDRDEWLAQWRENIVLFFFAASWPESTSPEWDGRLEYWGRWLWAPLVVFVFVGNVREFVRGRFDLIPVAVTLFTLVMALQNAVLTEGRYRKPVEPVLLLNLVWVLAAGAQRSEQAVRDQTLTTAEASA